ncbi:MAG: substrate-binding domain-containing protein, partial [Pirellulales bacterium]|nr:substrate-binding domain-containing protein [Pirellulales bacterium]
MPSKKQREIALVFPIWDSPSAELMQGINAYKPKGGEWILNVPPDPASLSLRRLKGWPGDGVIALLNSRADIKAAKEIGIPVVNLSGMVRDTGLPRVTPDYEALGRMAARHLLECGFRRFGYYGLKNLWFSQQRRDGFMREIAETGGECSVLEVAESSSKPKPWNHWIDPLEQWLAKLRPPVGILAVHDLRARTVIDVCRRMQLAVPNDVAVMGVDNDHVACELSPIPISSVGRNNRKAGYEAAALLDRLMNGHKPPAAGILIEPGDVICRRSTDVLILDDEYITASVQYIREHIEEPFGVERLLKVVPVSRRWLEIRFKQCLDCSPLEYMRRVRVERAKELLSGVQPLRMSAIAQGAGFTDAAHFRKVFLRV